jgi:hypothetical protein
MGKKFATFNEDGTLAARYDADLHDVLPPGALEISAADFRRSILETDGVWCLGPGGSLEKKPIAPPSLADLKAAKYAEIDAEFELEASALTAGYPNSERLTWAVQQSEALAWKANPEAATPYLNSLAMARGLDLDDMRRRTLDQTELFLAASALLLGKRQRLRDSVHAAASPQEVLAIHW